MLKYALYIIHNIYFSAHKPMMSSNKGNDSKSKGFGFSGFQVKSRSERSNALPPPPNSALSKQGYSTMTAITNNALSASWGIPKKRSKTEEE